MGVERELNTRWVPFRRKLGPMGPKRHRPRFLFAIRTRIRVLRDENARQTRASARMLGYIQCIGFLGPQRHHLFRIRDRLTHAVTSRIIRFIVADTRRQWGTKDFRNGLDSPFDPIYRLIAR